MNYRYDEAKATQAAAYLMKKYGGKMKYLKLLKLLYLANRESIRAVGIPIVPDTFVSMKMGPVMSNVLNAINGVDDGIWSKYIKDSGDYTVRLTKDPGIGSLSKRSLLILDQIDAIWHGVNQYKLVDWIHDNIPEWTDPKGSSLPIPPERIMEFVGLTPDMIASMEAEEKLYQEEDDLFARLQREEGNCVSCRA